MLAPGAPGKGALVDDSLPELCPRPSCRTPIRWNEVVCPRCGSLPPDPPNVRYARLHRSALLKRAAEARGRFPAATAALTTAAAGTRATVSMPPAVARALLTKETTLYQSYRGMVLGGGRRPAQPKDDQMRTAVEGRLYGSNGVGEIRYGALTLDGRGPRSYGEVAASLHDDAARFRSTVLEGNSYVVVGPRRARTPVPEGSLSGWEDRAELVVAAASIGLPTNPDAAALARAVLFSEGKRATDRFFEVHLWGPFNRESVAEWRVVAPPKEADAQLDLDIARKLAPPGTWFPA